jgi:ABC-type phosphate transport system auxiliary subunit
MNDDITLGELGRRIADVQTTVHGLTTKLDRDYVRTSDLTGLVRRIDSLESILSWAQRTVGAVIIVGLIGLLLTRPGGLP